MNKHKLRPTECPRPIYLSIKDGEIAPPETNPEPAKKNTRRRKERDPNKPPKPPKEPKPPKYTVQRIAVPNADGTDSDAPLKLRSYTGDGGSQFMSFHLRRQLLKTPEQQKLIQTAYQLLIQARHRLAIFALDEHQPCADSVSCTELIDSGTAIASAMKQLADKFADDTSKVWKKEIPTDDTTPQEKDSEGAQPESVCTATETGRDTIADQENPEASSFIGCSENLWNAPITATTEGMRT